MHHVQISDAVRGGVWLPDGQHYRANQIATLTDAEFAELSQQDLIYVLDLGGAPDIPPPPDPTGIRDLQSETSARIAYDQMLSDRIMNLEGGVSIPYIRGIVTLAAGTATVSITNVAPNSRIFLTAQSLAGVSTPQALAVTAMVPMESFTIVSASTSDTSVVAYLIIDPVIMANPLPPEG